MRFASDLTRKKTQTTQTRAFARAARRSRSLHSRAASPVLRTCSTLSHFVPSLAAAALELHEDIPNSY